MESYGFDMDDIFMADAEPDLDGEIAFAAPMPDLDDDEQPINRNFEDGEAEAGDSDGNEETDADVLKKLKDLSKGAAKKKVMRPQPKLDLERLQSKRGLNVLSGIFKDVKFGGKGHEARDLSLLMGKLEHWAHRLYPKMSFDDFIERLEKMGGKKPVQTCLKRIRLDMDMPAGDEVLRGGSDDEEEARTTGAVDNPEITDMDAEEAYEEMIRQEREIREKKRAQEKGTPEVTSTPPTNIKYISQENPSSASKGLTASQKERMERNRQFAFEKRLAKLGKTPTGERPSSQSVPLSQIPSAQKSLSVPDSCKNDGTTTNETSEWVTIVENTELLPEESESSSDLKLKLTATEDSETLANSTKDTYIANETTASSSINKINSPAQESATSKDAGLSLNLHMPSSEESESLQLKMSETDDDAVRDEDILLEGVCVEQDSGNINFLNKVDSENRHLELKLSVTDDEAGMDTD